MAKNQGPVEKSKKNATPRVAIVMGGESDAEVMRKAQDMLEKFGVSSWMGIVSAHRTPDRMVEFAKSARKKGFQVIIAGAGGAAHLPGMLASLTTLPVIGVPILSRNSLLGIDSILSILQMPAGVPVATVGLGNSENAALLALSFLGITDERIAAALQKYKDDLSSKVLQQDEGLRKKK